MNPKRFRWKMIVWVPVIALSAGLGIYALVTLGRPAPIPMKREYFEGVTYQRVVRYLPHAMIAHVMVIDRKETGAQFEITPPSDVDGGAVEARTTSQFLEEFDLQIAVNGDGFFPWWSRSPADYYPHSGDPVTPNGVAASYGEVYADGLQDPRPEPTIYITRRGDLTFNRAPNRIFHALSGDRMLVQSGEVIQDLNDTAIEPRTAIGTNHNGRWILLIVVDGRQPFYSAGATFAELADLMSDFGAFNAMSLDGGGSSTMVIEDENGEPLLLNSPIDSYIPGRERPVANHFGISINR